MALGFPLIFFCLGRCLLLARRGRGLQAGLCSSSLLLEKQKAGHAQQVGRCCTFLQQAPGRDLQYTSVAPQPAVPQTTDNNKQSNINSTPSSPPPRPLHRRSTTDSEWAQAVKGRRKGGQQYASNCVHTLLLPSPPACAPPLAAGRSVCDV